MFHKYSLNFICKLVSLLFQIVISLVVAADAKASCIRVSFSRSVPWLGEGLSMPSPSSPILCCPLPDRGAPIFCPGRLSTVCHGWSTLSYFLVTWSPIGDKRGPSVVFNAIYRVLYIFNFRLGYYPKCTVTVIFLN